ncbi:hypothetical protein HanIR_Chr07g0317531 [Helianthus annuus]|nr:hypothetical protein HanIR_Chr07g0317531 [Helianthus annuus]
MCFLKKILLKYRYRVLLFYDMKPQKAQIYPVWCQIWNGVSNTASVL